MVLEAALNHLSTTRDQCLRVSRPSHASTGRLEGSSYPSLWGRVPPLLVNQSAYLDAINELVLTIHPFGSTHTHTHTNLTKYPPGTEEKSSKNPSILAREKNRSKNQSICHEKKIVRTNQPFGTKNKTKVPTIHPFGKQTVPPINTSIWRSPQKPFQQSIHFTYLAGKYYRWFDKERSGTSGSSRQS